MMLGTVLEGVESCRCEAAWSWATRAWRWVGEMMVGVASVRGMEEEGCKQGEVTLLPMAGLRTGGRESEKEK